MSAKSLPRMIVLSLCTLLLLVVPVFAEDSPKQSKEKTLKVATFAIDITPPIGHPLCYGHIAPAKKVVDPLSARGMILLGGDQPIVLLALDWVGANNGAQDEWKKALAAAVGTSPDHCAVHCLHQHDAPGVDITANQRLKENGLDGVMYQEAYLKDVMQRTIEAAQQSLKQARPVTHVGTGKGKVKQFASNRRILGPDGKVKIVRFSSSRNLAAIKSPEGVIDPYVRLLSLWDGDQPLVVLSYYATHPQSYYGRGGISCDTVGLARGLHEKQLPGALQIHFDGAGGNIGAGKYNNGDPENRPLLAQRLADGMQAAWKSTEKTPVTAQDVSWSVKPVLLPLRDTLDEEKLTTILKNPKGRITDRIRAARDLDYLKRTQAGETIDITRLKIGPAQVVHMPGELFVEYQLAAQKMAPEDFVCMAAYGDQGPGYIGTTIAYAQGGYETGRVSRTAPEVEDVLMQTLRELVAGKQ
ncbi:hypothetical protein [Gimesia chilikensis]|uniref:Neutral/alkaline non-lysosomal ceramidase n=1 Tax=Gimesia chilikensis TaxID=2605989 RepID=A0A517PHJ3_9PLAN|nr:hypothetical protein [Gimesia chilikensis]QDT18846.1 hypothetical protein HG66A1_06080 [Gimesia chilikensis]